MAASNIDEMIQGATSRGDEVAASTAVALREERVPSTYTPRRPSLDALQNSSMSVDNWLKVTEDGLKIVQDNKSALISNLEVVIDMNEVVATTAIKFGQPPQYFKTYDGLICADGATRWEDAIAKGSRSNATPYDSADIPMTLDEDVKKDGAILMEKGQRIGYSLSTTNKGAFATFLRDLNEQGLRNSTVDVKLGYEARSNKNKQTWGIVTFELLGEHAPDPE